MPRRAPHADERNTPRQAVVLVHGIGEQKPMDTLRTFVTGLGYTDFYNKPDRFADGFELRRLTVAGQESRVPVDFYEFYWAYHFDQGQIRQTLIWAGKLVARRPFWQHVTGLRGAIGIAQITGLLIIAMVCWAGIQALRQGELAEIWSRWSATLGVVALILNAVAGGFVMNALADAPRYLTPAPPTVAGRNAIRAEGLALLRKLHESGEYQRLVVVGHSLGSVIALDLIRLLWDELRHTDALHPRPLTEARTIDSAASTARAATTSDQVREWQSKQYGLWRECRARGMPWLITDFITLGSPLAHASFLLEPSEWWRRRTGLTLRERQQEREVPTCPPDKGQGEIFYSARYRDPAYGQRNALTPHHGAPFAVTRWTNLYFPVRGLQGDPIGGPVAPEFGAGVLDVPVRTHPTQARTWSGLYLRSHTRYWRPDLPPGEAAAARAQRNMVDRQTGTYYAAGRLKDALGLEIEKASRKYPPPDPVEAGWSSEQSPASP